MSNTISQTPDHASAPLLHTVDARGVHSLALNRPGAFNALGEEMLDALQAALDKVALDASARVVVLSAQGKAFCAGHDLKELRARPEQAYYQQLFARCSRIMLAIQSLPVPVIARVQGLATAAGCQLVPIEALDDEVEKLVQSLLSKPREAIAMGKAVFYQQRETGIEAAYQLAGQAMACNLIHPVAQEGLQAFIEKRKPQWPMPAP